MTDTTKFGPRLMKVSIPECSVKNLPVERGDYGERRFLPYAHTPPAKEKQEQVNGLDKS
jgi:hypothetical protein